MGWINDLRRRYHQRKIDKVEGEKQRLIDSIREIGSGIRVEEQEGCDHPNLRALVKESLFYQCRNCKRIFFVWGVHTYDRDEWVRQMAGVVSATKLVKRRKKDATED